MSSDIDQAFPCDVRKKARVVEALGSFAPCGVTGVGLKDSRRLVMAVMPPYKAALIPPLRVFGTRHGMSVGQMSTNK